MNNTASDKIPFIAYFIWLLAALFFLYEFFLRTFIGSITSDLLTDLHISTTQYALMGTGYYLTYGLMQLSVGYLLQRYGERSILCFACFVCGVATLMFASASGFAMAMSSRLLMGFGSSFAFVSLLMVTLKWFPKRFFGLFIGVAQFIGTLGPVLAAGPLVHAISYLDISWRLSLDGIGVFGFLLGAGILLVLRHKPRKWHNDMVVIESPYRFADLVTLILKNKQAFIIALYSSMTYVSLPLLGAYWGASFIETHGIAHHRAADIISLSWLGYGLGCPLLGLLSDTINRRRPVLIMSACLGMLTTTLITFVPFYQPITYSLLFILLGFSASGASVGFALMADNATPSARPLFIGLNNCMVCLVAIIIPLISSTLINYSVTNMGFSLKDSTTYLWGLALMPVLYCLALVVSSFINETYCRAQKELLVVNY